VYLRFASGLIALAAIVGCPGPQPNPPIAGPVALPPQQVLCDRSDAQLALDRGLDSNAVNFAMANGYYGWCIPEYDDDQRFADGNGGNEYGPVAHVLAAPWLDTLQFTESYRQVAIVEVDPDSNSNPRPAPYNELGLHGQFHCLYLRLVTGPTDKFNALMAPPVGLQCPLTPTNGRTLTVAIDDPFSNNPGDYPPTTRFVEARGGRTLIGVKCGARWCVVGPGASELPSAHDNVPSLLTTAQGRVKGWFDDQTLGTPDGGPRYGIHRKWEASAIPDPRLGDLRVANFIVPQGTESYRTVGRVYFPQTPDPASKYVTVFGFSQGINTVGMRAEIHALTSDTVWFTEVRNAIGVKRDIPTVRMDHSKYFHAVYGERATIPATMRWRWFDKDEDLWVGCDIGCCLAGKGQ
jgi:hypothetical protein